MIDQPVKLPLRARVLVLTGDGERPGRVSAVVSTGGQPSEYTVRLDGGGHVRASPERVRPEPADCDRRDRASDRTDANLRFELRAYETADACRLASILAELSAPVVARDAVGARWAERYPRHAEQTGRRRIKKRIGRGLDLLRAAGIVRYDGVAVTVLDRDRLVMAAGNLAIVEDADGMAVPPALWSQRPTAPTHLREVQEPLEARRTALAADTNEEPATTNLRVEPMAAHGPGWSVVPADGEDARPRRLYQVWAPRPGRPYWQASSRGDGIPPTGGHAASLDEALNLLPDDADGRAARQLIAEAVR